jgi:tetratricopeptide (TPR) repeat protein
LVVSSFAAIDTASLRNSTSAPAEEGDSLEERTPSVVIREANEALKGQNFARAQTLYEEAIGKIEVEKMPVIWLTTELNLAHTLNLQGKRGEAVALVHRVVETCETRLGAADPLTSDAMSHLAWLLKQTGQLGEAEVAYRRNLSLLEAKYGAENFLVAKSLSQLAALLNILGRSDEAEVLHRRAHRIVCATLDESLPAACLIMTNLADCLLTTGKKAEALSLMDRASAIVETTSDADLPSAGVVLRTQAEFFQKVHQLERAEELARRAVLRLAQRRNSDRAKFFFYDLVTEVYQSVLRDRGFSEKDVEARMRALESAANQ